MNRPRALDLFCGAGGAAMGLYRAGFDVIGIDNKPQPRYPFIFIQADALNPPVVLTRFDFIWASPPCEHYSKLTPKAYRHKHADLIAPTRTMLSQTGCYFVIENVPSAAKLLKQPLMLCGSMFGLGIQRHRFFELGLFYLLAPHCKHEGPPVLISGTHRRTYEPRYEYNVKECREASGLTWMRRIDMDKAIPPAYSEFIGREVIKWLRR